MSDTAQPESTTLPATTVPAPAESTSTTIPAGTGTTGAPSFTVGSPTVTPPDPLPGSGGASGSGCEPGPGPLPDGVWFGEASATQTASVTFDLVCFFFLDHAYQAAADDGIDPDTVTNDLYIRNRNPETRDVPVDRDAVGWELVGIQVGTGPLGRLAPPRPEPLAQRGLALHQRRGGHRTGRAIHAMNRGVSGPANR